MRASCRLFCCCILFAASAARADVLLGLAFVDGLTGLNLEYMATRTSYYGVLGAHTNKGGLEADDLRWQLGLRKRLDRQEAASPGFYSGLVVGDLGGRKQYERLGVGAELGHQWVKSHTRTTVSGGFAVLERLEDWGLDAEPQFFLGVSWSLRR